MGVYSRNQGVTEALRERRPGKLAVMLVSSSPGDVRQLGQSLRRQRYDMRVATSLAGMDTIVRSGERVALAVIDLAGFGQAVWKHCERLRAEKIPFLVIADQRSSSVQTESLLHGARGVFTKPVGGEQLAEYVRATLGG